jgi:hypothetical protein
LTPAAQSRYKVEPGSHLPASEIAPLLFPPAASIAHARILPDGGGRAVC